VSAPPLPEDLDRDHAVGLLHQMLRIRRFEERCAQLYSETRIRGFLHLYVGEEAIASGAMQALAPRDAVVATYREHGHALARGMPMDRVMAEMYGTVDGVSRGRGGSMHLFDADTRFYGGNAIVAGGLPIAAGLALADRMRGDEVVTACFFGEGAVDEGEFHEAMNLAALWDLPVLFCCENNRYSMGMAVELAESQTELAVKAASYQMPAWSVDGMDVLAVEKAARQAVTAIRGGGGPHFLEFRTYRFRAHSMYDPDLYRPKEEIEEWKRRDPLRAFRMLLEDAGMLDEAGWAALEEQVEEELEAAIAFAEAAPLEPVEDLTRFTYSEVTT
jgi:pyruvate dehydrogenase E1 component alpha subunit